MFTIKVLRMGKLVQVCRPDLIKQVFTGDPDVLHGGEGNRVVVAGSPHAFDQTNHGIDPRPADEFFESEQ